MRKFKNLSNKIMSFGEELIKPNDLFELSDDILKHKEQAVEYYLNEKMIEEVKGNIKSVEKVKPETKEICDEGHGLKATIKKKK